MLLDSEAGQPDFDMQTAQQYLMQFDCLHPAARPGTAEAAVGLTVEVRSRLRRALLLVTQHSDYQMLGICADSLEQGQAALANYARVLGCVPPLPSEAIAGPVYLKYNAKTNRCYADAYPGEHRGVLVSCQSADEDDVNGLFGHLPLDLFEAE